MRLDGVKLGELNVRVVGLSREGLCGCPSCKQCGEAVVEVESMGSLPMVRSLGLCGALRLDYSIIRTNVQVPILENRIHPEVSITPQKRATGGSCPTLPVIRPRNVVHPKKTV